MSFFAQEMAAPAANKHMEVTSPWYVYSYVFDTTRGPKFMWIIYIYIYIYTCVCSFCDNLIRLMIVLYDFDFCLSVKQIHLLQRDNIEYPPEGT